jgi:biotin transporter BioY
MIRGSKTNPYGDKEIYGYFCKTCYRKRVNKRSKLLLWGSIGLSGLGVFFLGLTVYMYIFIRSLLEDQFLSSVATFSQLGIVLIFFGLVMLYVRYRELKKMKKRLRNISM